jgi:hypothetical protein
VVAGASPANGFIGVWSVVWWGQATATAVLRVFVADRSVTATGGRELGGVSAVKPPLVVEDVALLEPVMAMSVGP